MIPLAPEFRQGWLRSRILQLLQQGTLTTLTSALAGMRIWSPEFHPPAGFTADDVARERVSVFGNKTVWNI
ncbi:hypothetical protein BC826DRAFT_1049422 [Russula brevipes]|nr:hypothetical protein BC826DRAFT_1049422 [Russula brevipes]